MKELESNINTIKGIGKKTEEKLNRLNIYTVKDLLYYIPRSYEDRSEFIDLNEARLNESNSIKIKISGRSKIRRPRYNFSILEIPFESKGMYGKLIYFNQPYLSYEFKVGEYYKVFGKVEKRGKDYIIVNPIYEHESQNEKVGIIVPIYNLTEGISNNQLSKFIEKTLDEYNGFINDFMPKAILKKYGLLDINETFQSLHFPKTIESIKLAKKRLVFEELLLLQLALNKIKFNREKENRGIIFQRDNRINRLIKNLPFELTTSQKKVLEDISMDMESKVQMNRLVQGDVGSGKTVVAAIAIYKAILSGYQAAFMAPTEILAKQHYLSFKNFFKGEKINIAILTGSTSGIEKDRIISELSLGEIDIIIGTHALLEDYVSFSKLGLVITDEQHRFGVRERGILSSKDKQADILVMTATPIPRTLAYILYGDLDISTIEELPPGRQKIGTYAVDFSYLDRINIFIEKNIAQGRQVYVICPLVEKSESIKAYSAEELYFYYKDKFKNRNVGLIHGKLGAKEKDLIMGRFKDGDIDILVSTTVIEVGVDVENANIMLIYNAERFGLAQLHQLRGRVGRGKYKSHCILLNASNDELALERMKIMESTNNGFIISEKDLELRGPGEFFGTKQHGLPELRIANLFRDAEVLKEVKKESIYILDKNLLEDAEYKKLKIKVDELIKNLDNRLIIG